MLYFEGPASVFVYDNYERELILSWIGSWEISSGFGWCAGVLRFLLKRERKKSLDIKAPFTAWHSEGKKKNNKKKNDGIVLALRAGSHPIPHPPSPPIFSSVCPIHHRDAWRPWPVPSIHLSHVNQPLGQPGSSALALRPALISARAEYLSPVPALRRGNGSSCLRLHIRQRLLFSCWTSHTSDLSISLCQTLPLSQRMSIKVATYIKKFLNSELSWSSSNLIF